MYEKNLKLIGYHWAKEQSKGITDNRQVLIYDKTFKTYGILSLYGLSINFVIKNNPTNFIIYQLW